jgi:tripeptide aminopeptidase
MINQERLVREFMELVSVDSETKHEQQISQVLQKKLNELGLGWKEDDSAKRTGHGAGNLFVNISATEGKESLPRLFFTSHMDTVTPGQGIQPQLGEDGYIRSDGKTILGADDKAGIAAMLEAVKVIQEQQIPHGQIQLVITVGEESGLTGARAIDQEMLEADLGYALDSNGKVGEIVIGAPAQAKVRMQFLGRSAHAGVNPEDGISAITVASRAVSLMQLGRIDEETTANIGSFFGGGATNIVCEKAELMAEARSLDNAKLDRQLDHMRTACEAAATQMKAQVKFSSQRTYPAFKHSEDAPVVQLAVRAAERIGRTAKTLYSGGGSDANIFNGLGVPTANLAIGYERIHTTEEAIPVEELVKTVEMVLAIVQEVSGSEMAGV